MRITKSGSSILDALIGVKRQIVLFGWGTCRCMINEGHWVILDNFQDLYKSGVNDRTTFKSDGKRLGANMAERKKLSFVKVELEQKRQRDL